MSHPFPMSHLIKFSSSLLFHPPYVYNHLTLQASVHPGSDSTHGATTQKWAVWKFVEQLTTIHGSATTPRLISHWTNGQIFKSSSPLKVVITGKILRFQICNDESSESRKIGKRLGLQAPSPAMMLLVYIYTKRSSGQIGYSGYVFQVDSCRLLYHWPDSIQFYWKIVSFKGRF